MVDCPNKQTYKQTDKQIPFSSQPSPAHPKIPPSTPSPPFINYLHFFIFHLKINLTKKTFKKKKKIVILIKFQTVLWRLSGFAQESALVTALNKDKAETPLGTVIAADDVLLFFLFQKKKKKKKKQNILLKI